MPWTATEVQVRWPQDREHFEAITTADFIVSNGVAKWVVPEGFATDFASVPRLLWRIAGPLDGLEAAVFHDWLYATGRVLRKPADRMYYEVMRAKQIHPLPAWRARAMYRGVRLGGWVAWRKHRKAQA